MRPLAALALILLPSLAAAQDAPTRNFTPLDEIERVRKEGCGRDQFARFLGWYAGATTAGGWLEQVVWTDYMVKVGSLADPAAPGRHVDRKDYLGQFRITTRDVRASRDARTPSADTPYRRITMTRLDATHYRVDWRGGLPFGGVEPADRDKQAGAYLFEHRKDCWYLTGDLR
jgi:hypothetical protein